MFRFYTALSLVLLLWISTAIRADEITPGEIQDEYDKSTNKRTISIQLGDIDDLVDKSHLETQEHEDLFSFTVEFEGKEFPGLKNLKIYANSWIFSKDRSFDEQSKLHIYAHNNTKNQKDKNPVKKTFEIGGYEFETNRIDGETCYMETLKFYPVSWRDIRNIVNKKTIEYRLDDEIKKKVTARELRWTRKFVNYLKKLSKKNQ